MSNETRQAIRRYFEERSDTGRLSPDFTDRLLREAGLPPLRPGELEALEQEFSRTRDANQHDDASDARVAAYVRSAFHAYQAAFPDALPPARPPRPLPLLLRWPHTALRRLWGALLVRRGRNWWRVIALAEAAALAAAVIVLAGSWIFSPVREEPKLIKDVGRFSRDLKLLAPELTPQEKERFHKDLPTPASPPSTPEAQFQLARKYEQERYYHEAMQWYRKAALGGHEEAASYLAEGWFERLIREVRGRHDPLVGETPSSNRVR